MTVMNGFNSSNGSNDYIQTPDGGRIRWIRPQDVERRAQVVEGRLRVLGTASIDVWQTPEPPDAA
ncbi:hypothetical protein D3C72_719450 [compost metagenome]